MERKEIKYIGFYDFADSQYKRVSNLAATNKMDYIADAIIEAGYKVHFISPSWTEDTTQQAEFIKQETIQLAEHKKITFCPNFTTKRKLTRNFKIVFSLLWLFFWLIKNIKKNEKVLMYHVQWLALPIRWAKKIRGFKLILEVEEIYGDVSAIHPYFYTLENKLIEVADYYLFSTDLLVKRIGDKKPFIVIYGAYNIYPQLSTPCDDGKIHLLYAGVIDTHKAGAFNALEAAKYLPDNYVLHIIGFGEIDLLKRKIQEVNEVSGCEVVYGGLLSGDEYVKYCQKCHIGLSTQNTVGDYLETSFPSKILSYLGMGLNVVSGEIECVKISEIGHIVTYYTEATAFGISKAIKETKLVSSNENVTLIQELDKNFTNRIKKLLI